jgi:tetratricopeptide (TPR) repeat protein
MQKSKKKPSSKAPDPSAVGNFWRRLGSPWLAGALIVVAVVAAYGNSLHGPFVFDDQSDIVENPSIRHLWPISEPFVARLDGKLALQTRPIASLSLAVNYAIGGQDPFSYHVVNVTIHVLAALLFFGLVRRTLKVAGTLRVPSAGPMKDSADGTRSVPATFLALSVALLWSLHPLQTEAVTYVVQRYESMMGLFYFASLYCVVRGSASSSPARWYAASVASCLLALGCKEVAVSIPMCVLLYDRAFLAGSFRDAWHRRRGLYLGLAAVLAAYAACFPFTASRSAWAGFGIHLSWFQYVRTQPGVILHYLCLAFWPHPLVLDYDWPVADSVGAILPGLVVVGALAVATLVALVRRPAWGFLGAWFFLILAPTSSILPLRDLAFEHRMYLPLAAIVVLGVLGGYALWRRWGPRPAESQPHPASLPWAVPGVILLIVAVALGAATRSRNHDYRSKVAIFQDTVDKRPTNARAHHNLAMAFAKEGRVDEAAAEFRLVLENRPNLLTQWVFVAFLSDHSRLDEAIAMGEEANRLYPPNEMIYYHLGRCLAKKNRMDEAIAEYEKALNLRPNYVLAHYELGNALVDKRDFNGAISHWEKVVEFDPNHADAHGNLGSAFYVRGDVVKALFHWRESIRLEPDVVPRLNQTALVLATNPDASVRNGTEAVELAQRAVRLTGARDPVLLNTLAAAQAETGQFPEAVETLRRAIDLAAARGDRALVETLQARQTLYRSGAPFRDPQQPVPARPAGR